MNSEDRRDIDTVLILSNVEDVMEEEEANVQVMFRVSFFDNPFRQVEWYLARRQQNECT